jgi:hypothetical protein
MHGHSRGHPAVIARTGARWLVHAGDACYHRGTVERTGATQLGLTAFERLTQVDAASAAALRQLRTHSTDLDLFCAHDPRRVRRAGRPTG